jgi:hypothetical protein
MAKLFLAASTLVAKRNLVVKFEVIEIHRSDTKHLLRVLVLIDREPGRVSVNFEQEENEKAA